MTVSGGDSFALELGTEALTPPPRLLGPESLLPLESWQCWLSWRDLSLFRDALHPAAKCGR